MKSIRTPEFSLWQNFAILLGRLLGGWIFVESGSRKLMGMEAFIESLSNRRVPYATAVSLANSPLPGRRAPGWASQPHSERRADRSDRKER